MYFLSFAPVKVIPRFITILLVSVCIVIKGNKLSLQNSEFFFFTILIISPFLHSEAECEIGTALVKVVIYIEVKINFFYMLNAEILPFS